MQFITVEKETVSYLPNDFVRIGHFRDFFSHGSKDCELFFVTRYAHKRFGIWQIKEFKQCILSINTAILKTLIHYLIGIRQIEDLELCIAAETNVVFGIL